MPTNDFLTIFNIYANEHKLLVLGLLFWPNYVKPASR